MRGATYNWAARQSSPAFSRKKFKLEIEAHEIHDHLEAAAQAGRDRRAYGQEAWPKSGPQPSGQEEPRSTGRRCSPDQEAEECRVDHRGSKKVAALLGKPIPNIQIDEENL